MSQEDKKKPNKQHLCDQCGKVFGWPAHLREHMQHVHAG